MTPSFVIMFKDMSCVKMNGPKILLKKITF
jgi:hypothetical protein